MRSLAARTRDEEQMDDPALAPEDYAGVIRDLGRVNRWTFAARPTLAFLRRATSGVSAFRLLDVGYGDGGMLRAIAAWAAKRGIEAELVGVDLNEKSEPAARALTPDAALIDYRTGDYRDQGRFDFVISSLVAHHMDDRELRDFLRFMEAEAVRGWMVNDLHRRLVPYLGFPLLAGLLRVHKVVRHDGQLSVARSFRPDEWRDILADAGISPATPRIARYFPYRLCVERLR